MKAARIPQFVFFLLLITAGAALSQTRTAGISGRVVELGTSKPLARATVELASGQARYPALTDAEGRFEFKNVPPGRYSLTASLTGYLHAEYGRKMPNLLAGGRGNLVAAAARRGGLAASAVSAASLPVQLDAGRAASEVVLAMAPAVAISGRVFNAKGEPFAYVQLQAQRIIYPDGERTSVVMSAVFTNDLGEYRFFGLPAGQYLIRADTAPQAQIYNPVAASTAPPLPGGIVIQTASGGIGYVGDPANQNIPLGRGNNRGGRGPRGAAEAQEPTLVPLFFRDSTNERDAAVVDTRPGDDVTGIDIVVRPVPLINVSVAVSGLPNASFTVSPTPSAGGRGSGAARGASNLTLPPGSYVISSITNAGPAARGNPATPLTPPDRLMGYAPLDVTPFGAPPVVTIALNPATGVSGRITVDGGASVVPADSAKLSIRFRRNPAIAGIPDPPNATPDLEGLFTARGFIDGDYMVEVSGFQGSLSDVWVRSVRFAGTDVLDTGARITDRPAAEIEVTLARGAVQLAGSVVTANGTGADAATVVLIPDQRSRRDLYRVTTSDANGRFRMEGVAPGGYTLFAWEEELETGSWFAPDFIRLFEGRGLPLTAGGDNRANIEARVIPIR